MKQLSLVIILVSTSFVAAPLTAAAFEAGYHCHTPRVYDAGFIVQVDTLGRSAGVARVVISEASYAGERRLASSIVSVTPFYPDTLFEGDGLALTVRQGPWRSGDGRRIYHAAFTAMTRYGVVRGRLDCSSLWP